MDSSLVDISRAFRNVTKFIREKTEDIFGNVTDLERSLREISDDDSCAIPNSLLRNIAQTSHDITAYPRIIQTVLEGITSESWQWRRIYKSLALLYFMLLLGPARVRMECVNAQMTLRTLSQFRYNDGYREQGGGIRQHATRILQLIEDNEQFDQAKKQAIEDSSNYIGIENNPTLDYQGSNSTFFQGPSSVPPIMYRQQQPSPPNPFATIHQFQSDEDAARVWGVPTSDDAEAKTAVVKPDWFEHTTIDWPAVAESNWEDEPKVKGASSQQGKQEALLDLDDAEMTSAVPDRVKDNVSKQSPATLLDDLL